MLHQRHSSQKHITYLIGLAPPHESHGGYGRRSHARPSVPALTVSYSHLVFFCYCYPAYFPLSAISLPVPSWHIAETIQRALAVDKEISPYVHREFAVPSPSSSPRPVVVIYYKATTARMLRVSTNGIFESLGTVLRVCQELDLDVLEKELDG